MNQITKYFSLFILSQLMFLLLFCIFLIFTDKFPSNELSLVVERMKFGKPAQEKDAEDMEPKVLPSLEQQLDRITSASQEIERRGQQVQNTLLLVDAREKDLETKFQSLMELKKQVDEGIEKETDENLANSKRVMDDFLETMKPKNAKNFLLAVEDDNEAIAYIKLIDPNIASKIFKEFKADDEMERLNLWLEELGQGEPEKSKMKAAKENTEVF